MQNVRVRKIAGVHFQSLIIYSHISSFTGVVRATTGSTFVGQPRYTRYKAYDFGCSGSETNLGDCSHSLNIYRYWDSNEGAGVVCSY